MEKTIEIPEGYEARIEGNKVILEPKESEDERIRKELIEFLDELWHLGKNTNFDRWGKADCAKWITYLERQKGQKPAKWKPSPESMEALLLAIKGKWDAIKPTGYMSRRLEDLYDGLVNTFDVDEKYLDNLPKTEYTKEDIEEIKSLKKKIDSSMEQQPAEYIEASAHLGPSVTTNGSEWSEEDEERLNTVISLMRTSRAVDPFYDKMCLESWLKSLPERFNLQPKQEWSEEDKRIMDNCIEYIKASCLDANDLHECTNWLKSLRPAWKPSEEQMNALNSIILNGSFTYVGQVQDLISLKDELKKLSL